MLFYIVILVIVIFHQSFYYMLYFFAIILLIILFIHVIFIFYYFNNPSYYISDYRSWKVIMADQQQAGTVEGILANWHPVMGHHCAQLVVDSDHKLWTPWD